MYAWTSRVRAARFKGVRHMKIITKYYIQLFMFFLLVLFSSENLFAETFMSDDLEIYYTDSKGQGETIVLIHGYSMSSSMWHEIGAVEELSKSNRVIAIDCRGHGKSEKPEVPTEYGPKVGADVINLLNHLEIDKAHMVGYSMGAFVVGRLVVTHPNRISTAVLGSGFFPVDDKEEFLFHEKTALDMESHGENALAAVARGWKLDSVSDEEISNIIVPIQAIFGSEEINSFFESQKHRLMMPRSDLPIVIIDGADHDSSKAAVLHPQFLETVQMVVASNRNSK